MVKLTVSVVVPTYNRAHSVGAALDSILTQIPPPDEVIVVDDGSTDNTSEVLAAYGDRLIVLRQENAGAAAARNAGIRRAAGEWVAFLDSDDVWLPGRMAVLHRDLSEASEDIVGHTGDISLSGFNYTTSAFKLRNWNFPVNNAKCLENPLFEAITGIHPPVTAIRRELIFKCGGFCEKRRIYEDAPLFCRLALSGSWLFTGEVLAEARRLDGDENALSSIEEKQPTEAAEARVDYISHLLNDDLPPSLVNMVKRKLSGAFLMLAAAEATEHARVPYRTLIRSARLHPSPIKGWLKILPPLLLGKRGFRISLRGHKAFTRS